MREGVFTGQISIAPRYHDELLQAAEDQGRKLESIMAQYVEEHADLENERDVALERIEELESAIKKVYGIWLLDSMLSLTGATASAIKEHLSPLCTFADE